MSTPLNVEVWSDFVCPFCIIGKQRLEAAARAENIPLAVTWRSFELDPEAPAVHERPLVELLATKYGMGRAQAEQAQAQIGALAAELGIAFNWQQAQPGNTFDAHRLAHFAAERGLGEAAQQALMQAYFTDGKAIGDHAVLQAVGEAIGLPADAVRDLLAGDAHADAVRRDELIAQRELQVRGVPFFVFDGRLAVSGAQSPELFRQALRQAVAGRDAALLEAAGAVCTDAGCTPDQSSVRR